MASPGTGPAAQPTNRPTLTRQRVLEAAVAIIDRDGVEGLSMRKLGTEVGVEAMSLYNHVSSKDDVLDGVVSRLWADIAARTGDDGGSWQQQARVAAAAVRTVAQTHPDAYPLVLTRGVLPWELLVLGGRLLTALRAAGFGDLAPQAMLALGSHITSQALSELAWYGERAATAAPEPPDAPSAAALEAGRALATCDTDDQFAFTLELLIDGLETRLAAARGTHPSRHELA